MPRMVSLFRYRLARVVTLLLTFMCGAGTLIAGGHINWNAALAGLVGGSGSTPVSEALVNMTEALACLLGVRLFWIFAQASHALLRTRPESACAGTPLPPAPGHRPNTLGLKLAGLILTFMAFGAAPATAAPAPTPAPTVTTADYVPLPSFTDSQTSASETTPTPTVTTDAPGSATLGQDDFCPAAPAWTPTADFSVCDLILGPQRPSDSGMHTVTRGETLWSIAAKHLPAGASHELITRAVEAWLTANPGLAHPDLIHVGDQLHRPVTVEAVR